MIIDAYEIIIIITFTIRTIFKELIIILITTIVTTIVKLVLIVEI
jgi:hypothetical protein